MLAGLIAGSVAALVASLVSLPLRSPLDIAFNTLTVTVASLVVGIASGLLWKAMADNPRRLLYYAGGLAAAFVVVAVVALVGNMWLERFAAFTIPLAAIVFALSGILAPMVGGISVAAVRGLAVVLLIASIGLGIGLASQGDTESGELSLPERVEAPTPTATEPASQETTPAATADTTPEATVMAVSTEAPSTSTPSEAIATAVTPAAPAGGTSRQYVVVEGSEITFTVGEVLSRLPTPIEAVLRTSELSGQINLDGQPSTVEVNLHSLNSDQQYRDRYVQLQMFPQHPVASFTLDSVNELPGEFDSGDTFQRSVSGTLNVKGADFPISFDLEVRNDGDLLNVLGRTVFTWQQLDVPVPTARSVVSIDDEVHVEILLVAKPN
jgi:polyisoprenoid-binding protein YceI